ncbi:hypothetical protein C8R41DRAFT_924178 [Lentinula lateritia]|uniref:Uncharacterized protein n=1 Tax=Lentinula lateritia TaxID=40482 RepID=A0ABQ8V9R8_9AGAR|nr:hypothetical protein C8R41DRAFT_924178 [Lentinula lateritia]
MSMSLIVGNQVASAAYDSSIYYSSISHSFLWDQCGNPCTSGTFQSLVTISTPYFAYSIPVDFFVFDDSRGFHTILGVQFWQSCDRLRCTDFISTLPLIQSNSSQPLPLYPSHAPLGPVTRPGVSGRDTLLAPSGEGLVRHSMESVYLTTQPTPIYAASSSGPIAAPLPGSNTIGSVCTPTSNDIFMSASSSMLPVDLNTRPSSLHLLRASLLRHLVTGVRCSAFAQDIIVLNRYAALHGLDLHGLVDVRSSQQAIIHHILAGQCFATKDIASAGHIHACEMFVADFDSKIEYFEAIADLLQSSKAVDLPVEKLKLMLESVCETDRYQPRDTHRQMLRGVQKYLTHVQAGSVAKEDMLPDSAPDIISGLDRFPLPVLLLYCRQHGVDICIATATVPHIREQLGRHLVKGLCYANHDLPGCRTVVNSFTLGSRTPVESYSQSDGFKSLLLRLLGHKLKSRPLKLTLDILKIPYLKSETKKQLQARLQLYVDNISSLDRSVAANIKMDQIRKEWPTLVPTSVTALF